MRYPRGLWSIVYLTVYPEWKGKLSDQSCVMGFLPRTPTRLVADESVSGRRMRNFVSRTWRECQQRGEYNSDRRQQLWRPSECIRCKTKWRRHSPWCSYVFRSMWVMVGLNRRSRLPRRYYIADRSDFDPILKTDWKLKTWPLVIGSTTILNPPIGWKIRENGASAQKTVLLIRRRFRSD